MAALSIGVKGLDSLLEGGIPEGNTILLLAPPGAGKTTLCIRFAADAIRNGKKVLYVSTGSPIERFKENMKLAGCEYKAENCAFIDGFSWRQPGEHPESTASVMVLASISNLNDFARVIDTGIKAMGGVDAIVLDSISDLVLYSDPQAVYKFLQLLQGEVAKNKAAGLVVLEFGLHDEKVNNTINYVFQGVIEMATNAERKLRITRMTGAPHSREWVKYEIKPGLKIVLFNNGGERK